MKYQIRLIEVQGDQEDFADLIGTVGYLTTTEGMPTYMPNNRSDWLTMDVSKRIDKDGKITFHTKLGNIFIFKIL